MRLNRRPFLTKTNMKPNNDTAYLQELNDAVASIQTHPCYSADVVFAWMKSWGSENELPLPSPDIFPDNPNIKNYNLP